MADLSIHDNFVTGYSVNCEDKKIVIHTEYRDKGDPYEYTDVVFEDVHGYFLKDNLKGILFDIEESTTDYILQQYRSEIETGSSHGWPGMWNDEKSAITRYIIDNSLKVWDVCSSIGFDGFVISRTMMFTKIEPNTLPDGTS